MIEHNRRASDRLIADTLVHLGESATCVVEAPGLVEAMESFGPGMQLVIVRLLAAQACTVGDLSVYADRSKAGYRMHFTARSMPTPTPTTSGGDHS